RFMARVFEDVREEHRLALKQCIEGGLDSATEMFEVLDGLGNPQPVPGGRGSMAPGRRGDADGRGTVPPIGGAAGRSAPSARIWGVVGIACGVIAVVLAFLLHDGGEGAVEAENPTGDGPDAPSVAAPTASGPETG